MVLRIYNTLSGKKEVFKSLEKNVVRMYVCGVTPYDQSHVGHARSYVAFDVIRRSLEYLGYKVNYVQNFTDVDDKIIEAAKKEGISPLDLSKRYIEEFFLDMDSLGIKRADSYPKVSEKIPEIIGLIKVLIEKKKAYEVDGDVYLDVSKKRDYGTLSHQPIEELKAGARVEVDEKKKNPLDFVLWKKAKPEEISWDSPWGKGRPGWHIECSAMSMDALGSTLDIHGGGQDLIFPHHENEIAQSESYSGKPFVRYWMHNGLITVGGEKMSKSLGNFITIRELLKGHNPMALRFFLLSANYRRNLDFTKRALEDAEKGLLRIQNTIFNIKNALSLAKTNKDGFSKRSKAVKRDFTDALEDDFNMPLAVAVLFDFIREVNTYLSDNPGIKGLTESLRILKELTGVLGLTFEEEISPLVRDLVEIIIKLRSELRMEKDFEGADHIRNMLSEIGITLEDRSQGTFWHFTTPFGSQ